jgi:hypothetical protein
MLLQRRNYGKCGENEEGDQEHELRLTFDHRTSIYREDAPIRAQQECVLVKQLLTPN